LKKKKSFIPKKEYFLGHCQYQNKKALFTDPIFSEGFGKYMLTNNNVESSYAK
jgi:hypothetical protein